MMNNDVLKAILNEYGTKVRAIRCNNVFIQLNQSTQNIKAITADDIKYKTYGDTDFIIVPIWDSHHQRYFDSIIKTDQVEVIGCVRNDSDVLDIYCM